jgi:uncharacterized membrane protein YfcA
MNELLEKCLIICPLVFMAGFVDAIAGGGGLISLPAYMLAGLPTHIALGTNKVAMSFGTFIAAGKYIKAKEADLRVGIISAAGAFIGSSIGSSIALLIAENVLKIIILLVLPAVAVFLLVKKDFGKNETERKVMSVQRLAVTAFIIGAALGCYDGLIGPGAGTFLILAFTAFLGIDLLKSSGCAKITNLASNIASMIVFIINGKVIFAIAIPAAIFAMAGNYTGARLAIKGGSRYVRYAVLFVIGLLFVKTAIDLFSKPIH